MFFSTVFIQTLSPPLFAPTVCGWWELAAQHILGCSKVWKGLCAPFPAWSRLCCWSCSPRAAEERQRCLGVGHNDSKGWKRHSHALGWVCAAAAATAATTWAPPEDFLPFSCALSRSLWWGWQCAQPRDSPEPQQPLLCWAGQGLFPFLPKDGTRIHQNRAAAPWISPGLWETPAGPSLTSWPLSILPWQTLAQVRAGTAEGKSSCHLPSRRMSFPRMQIFLPCSLPLHPVFYFQGNEKNKCWN